MPEMQSRVDAGSQRSVERIRQAGWERHVASEESHVPPQWQAGRLAEGKEARTAK